LYHKTGKNIFCIVRIDKYICERMGNEKKKLPEIRVRGIAGTLPDELQNIADHLGIGRNQFLKLKLREIANSYPDNMKTPMDDC